MIGLYFYIVGRHFVVGIATRYGLEVKGIYFRLGEIFRTLPTALEPTLPLVKWVPVLFRGGKERVELYLYFPSGPS
jgi:hypothetical protein